MAIRNRDILHTDMKCDEFHEVLSPEEKQNLINKLESYVSTLHSEVRCTESERKLHLALQEHHAQFGIKYVLTRELPGTDTPVQRSLAKMREERGQRRPKPQTMGDLVKSQMEERRSCPKGGTLINPEGGISVNPDGSGS